MTSRSANVGEREIRLEAPGSMTIRHEIVASAASNWRRAFGAALGACWRGPGRPKVRYGSCDYNPLRYGGEVLDELDERGEDLEEVLAAAGAAFGMLAEGMISEEEVEKKASSIVTPGG